MVIFDGAEIQTTEDNKRVETKFNRIFDLMSDSKYRTLKEISELLNIPEATASAILRSFRREKFGGHTVNRRARGDRKNGLFEYQLVIKIANPDALGGGEATLFGHC